MRIQGFEFESTWFDHKMTLRLFSTFYVPIEKVENFLKVILHKRHINFEHLRWQVLWKIQQLLTKQCHHHSINAAVFLLEYKLFTRTIDKLPKIKLKFFHSIVWNQQNLPGSVLSWRKKLSSGRKKCGESGLL